MEWGHIEVWIQRIALIWEITAVESHQPAFAPRNQNLLLLNEAGGFQDRLQTGEEALGRLDRVGQDQGGGQVVVFRLSFLVRLRPSQRRRGTGAGDAAITN